MNGKKLSALLCAAVLVFSAAGCGKGGNEALPESSQIADEEESQVENMQDGELQMQEAEGGLDEETPVTLTVYGPSIFSSSGETGAVNPVTGNITQGYQVVVERWEELHPNVTLNIEGIGWSDWRAAIQAAVLGGGVDIICHGGLLPVLCEPLDSYIEKDPDFLELLYSIPKYNTDEMEGSTLDNPRITSIPNIVNPGFMILDKKIFDDYGVLLPDADWTWSDVVSLAGQLTGTDPVTGENTYGFLLPNTGGTGMIKNHLIIASAYDAGIISYGSTAKESTVNFQTESVTKVYRTINDLAQYCSPDNVEGVEGNLVIRSENNVAMSWTENFLRDLQTAKELGEEERFVFLPLPVIEEGQFKGCPSLYLGDNNFAISKDSENKEWAWEFIKFMLTDDVAIAYMIDNGGIVNTVQGMEILKQQIGENDVLLQQVLEQLPSDYNSTTNTYYDNVNFGAMGSYLSSELREMIKGSISVEQAVDNTQKAVDEYFATLE